MVPIVAFFAHNILQKVGARLAARKFGSQVKQPPAPLPKIELERVEPNLAQQRRAPAQDLLKRIQQSFAEGDRALAQWVQSKSASAARPEELHALHQQVARLNDEVERLSQTVERSMKSLSVHAPPSSIG
ncbi:MAG: hypothetical protein QM723_31430 [Myxococcaceae bacterium]